MCCAWTDSAAEAASTPAEAEAEVVRAAHAGECTAALAVEEGAAPLVLLRMPGSGKLVAAEVATLPGSATRLIRFGPFVGRSPYRVANRSSHPVAVRQWNDSAVPMLVRRSSHSTSLAPYRPVRLVVKCSAHGWIKGTSLTAVKYTLPTTRGSTIGLMYVPRRAPWR